jgi:hypothetical protein
VTSYLDRAAFHSSMSSASVQCFSATRHDLGSSWIRLKTIGSREAVCDRAAEAPVLVHVASVFEAKSTCQFQHFRRCEEAREGAQFDALGAVRMRVIPRARVATLQGREAEAVIFVLARPP